MYRPGEIVTLLTDKDNGDPKDTVTLRIGTCGLVIRRSRRTDENHEYVIDFGAYGGWYCTHNELSGNDAEGYEDDAEDTEEEDRTPGGEIQTGTNQVEEERSFGTDDISVPIPLIVSSEEPVFVLDVEKDIARRMKEIERGDL